MMEKNVKIILFMCYMYYMLNFISNDT